MRILQWLLQTDSGVVGLILRITLAVVILQQSNGPINFPAGFSE